MKNRFYKWLNALMLAFVCFALLGGAPSLRVMDRLLSAAPSGLVAFLPLPVAARPVEISNKRAAVPLREMIGQMLMLGFSGTDAADQQVKTARKLLVGGDIGGLILMGHNLEDRAQVKKLISFFKAAPLKHPPLIAIDQEGGKVQRLRAEHGFTDVPQAALLGSDVTPAGAQAIYQLMAEELADVGFNVNFGPVVDIDLVPHNPIIGLKGRSYGREEGVVINYAKAFVLAHRQRQILTSLKHFPGHGSSWTDSHEQFVDLTKSWQNRELAPYQQMIRAGLADMVMVGHLYHPEFSDKAALPASLSRKAIRHLRRKMNYDGVVITDDLGMGAIRKYFPFEEVIIRSVNAGNDILLLVDDKLAVPEQINRIHKIIRQAIVQKKISLESIRRSYKRILKAKSKLPAGQRASKS